MKTAQILMHRPRSIKVELSKNVASDTPLLRGDWAAENEYRLSQSERNNSKWIALPLPISRWWMDVMSLSILRWLRKATALHAANLMFCGLSTTKLSFFRDRLWVHSQKWCGKKSCQDNSWGIIANECGLNQTSHNCSYAFGQRFIVWVIYIRQQAQSWHDFCLVLTTQSHKWHPFLWRVERWKGVFSALWNSLLIDESSRLIIGAQLILTTPSSYQTWLF